MGAAEQGADMAYQRWLVSPRTLIFLTYGNEILLIKRSSKRRIFPGKFNGLGGHLERDEDPLSGAYRELEEEAGIRPKKLLLKAIYHIDPNTEMGVIVFVFMGISPTRELRVTHTEEGELCWLPISRLAEYELVEDLPTLLKKILGENTNPDSPIYAHLSYDESDNLKMRFHEG